MPYLHCLVSVNLARSPTMDFIDTKDFITTANFVITMASTFIDCLLRTNAILMELSFKAKIHSDLPYWVDSQPT